MKTAPTIFDRFRAAVETDLPSGDLAALSADIGAERQRLAADAGKLDERSLDLTVSPAEAHAAREEAARLRFDETRLAGAAEQVSERLKEATRRERNAELTAAYLEARSTRDAAVEKVRKAYPKAVAAVMDLVTLIGDADVAVSAANGAKPEGHAYLDRVEETLGSRILALLNLPALDGQILHEANHGEMAKLREAAFHREQRRTVATTWAEPPRRLAAVG